MAYTMLKTTFQKSEPKQLIYRDLKNFHFESFKNDLLENMVTYDRSHDEYDRKFTAVLNKHVPKKKKWLRGNQKPHIHKTLMHEIMKRSKLKNIANKTKSASDIMNYKKQRNYVVQLNKKAKLEYFNNFDSSQESKPFWVKCKPYFSNKHSKADTDIILHEKGDIIFKNKEIANTCNEYFESIVESLDLHIWTESSLNVPPSYTSDDDIDKILIRFVNHPSIKTIKQNFNITSKFSFQPASVNDVKQVIKDLKSNQSVGGDIPINILKECNFTFSVLADCINTSFENGAFPDCLKEANVTPIFKKDDSLDKENYRPVSILPLLSKIFEKKIYKQLSNYTESFLSVLLCGFRKAHNTQHALFKLLYSWQKELEQKGFVGTILMDLSKAYDCIPHDLLIAKLECCGIDKIGLSLILDYLSCRKQRTKIGSSYSSWYDIIRGGSVLWPLLFNIFINDLFLLSHYLKYVILPMTTPYIALIKS